MSGEHEAEQHVKWLGQLSIQATIPAQRCEQEHDFPHSISETGKITSVWAISFYN